MEESFEKPALSKSILAALFSGLIATCVGIAYNIAYRGITHLDPSFIINIPSIIFGSLIASMIAGVLFYLCITFIKRGIIVYRLVFLVLCVLLAIVALNSHYGNGAVAYRGFSGLLLGVDVILGIFIILVIPYFFKHNKIFMD